MARNHLIKDDLGEAFMIPRIVAGVSRQLWQSNCPSGLYALFEGGQLGGVENQRSGHALS